MKTFAQALDLRSDPGLVEEYRRHHRAVWPEVTAALRSIGIRNMRIWLGGTRLFMTYDAPDHFDPRRDFQTYAENPRCRQWDEWMRTFQTKLADAASEDWWMPLEQVFDLERSPGDPPVGAAS